MKTNRRHFFKQVALGGLGAAGLSLGTPFHAEGAPKSKNNLLSVNSKRFAGFNMCGFAAPKLDTVRVGFIGVGNRGFANMKQMTYLEGVQIKAICDITPFRIDEARNVWPIKNSLPPRSIPAKTMPGRRSVKTRRST